MKIVTHFLDGSLEEYNTDSHFASSDLFKSNGICAMTCRLNIDDLSKGLYVQFFRHDFNQSVVAQDEVTDMFGHSTTKETTQAGIFLFGEDQVLDCRRLKDMFSVEVDGKQVLCRSRLGGHIVNSSKFRAQCALYLSEKIDSPTIENAVELYYSLHGDGMSQPRMPRLDGETEDVWNTRIANAMGWDVVELLNNVKLHELDLKASAEADPDYALGEDADMLVDEP